MQQRKPYKMEARQGVVEVHECQWGVYRICQRGERVWIEASGWGGAQRHMPAVTSIEEAREVIAKSRA